MIELKGQYCKDIKIFTDNVEEEALSVLYHISEMKAYEGRKVRIMPDVHKGVGDTVIGFSCPIDIEHGYASVQAVGVDIGCTVSAWFYDKPIIEDKLVEFEHKIRKAIPFGFNINEHSKVDAKTIMKAFNKAINKLCSKHPLFSDYAISFNKEKDLEEWCKKLNMDYGLFIKSIGSVGGGETIATV